FEATTTDGKKISREDLIDIIAHINRLVNATHANPRKVTVSEQVPKRTTPPPQRPAAPTRKPATPQKPVAKPAPPPEPAPEPDPEPVAMPEPASASEQFAMSAEAFLAGAGLEPEPSEPEQKSDDDLLAVDASALLQYEEQVPPEELKPEPATGNTTLLSSDNADVLYKSQMDIAQTAYRAGDYKKSLDTLKTIVQLDSSYVPALKGMQLCYKRMGNQRMAAKVQQHIDRLRQSSS
ncbi:MAG: hypothetical protein AAF787_10530, partial [Chloroflexota bacterium]